MRALHNNLICGFPVIFRLVCGTRESGLGRATLRDYGPALFGPRDRDEEDPVEETGIRNGAFGIEKFGFSELRAVHWNLTEPALYEHALRAKEAEVAYGGALVAETGVHTRRSPKDKFVVRDALTDKTVWWDNNGALPPQQFQHIDDDFIAHPKGKAIFAQA